MPTSNDTFALADIYAKAIRLAFHDAAEFDIRASDRSGPDGCLSNSSLNNGLIEPTSLVNTFIEPLWQSVCDLISRADFWAMFSIIMAEEAALPSVLKIPFSYGRQDSGICHDYNRLPDAQKGFDEISSLFVTRMGLTLADGVVLQGSHSLGHVHKEISGYFLEESGTYTPLDPRADVTVNAWDTTPDVLDNNYFISMFIIAWANVKVHASNGKRNIWIALTGPVVALNTDMAVGFNIDAPPPYFGANIAGNYTSPADVGQVCLMNSTEYPEVNNFVPCRPEDAALPFFPCPYGCTKYNTPFSYVGLNTTEPSTLEQVMAYTQSNDLFLKDYAKAFSRMITVGYGVSPGGPGKLGLLTPIDLDSCPPYDPCRSSSVSQLYQQCGGKNWNGPTTCAPCSTCQRQNDYYSQCRASSCPGLPLYAQCHQGATACQACSKCVVQSQYYAQCLPVRDSSSANAPGPVTGSSGQTQKIAGKALYFLLGAMAIAVAALAVGVFFAYRWYQARRLADKTLGLQAAVMTDEEGPVSYNDTAFVVADIHEQDKVDVLYEQATATEE